MQKRSLMIKCISHSFWSDGHVIVISLPVLYQSMVGCCVVTYVFRSNHIQSLTLRVPPRNGSDRLQNFIFVQRELARDEAVKWSDHFCDGKKNGAAECIPACEDKSSIKFGLLARKGNKLKWRSTQILFNR